MRNVNYCYLGINILSYSVVFIKKINLLRLSHIVCIEVSNPPQKHHPLFLAKPPSPLNRQTVQAPPF